MLKFSRLSKIHGTMIITGFSGNQDTALSLLKFAVNFNCHKSHQGQTDVSAHY